MKIRIKNNSIRYRLTRTDVAKLASDGFLEEKVDFCGNSLIYSVSLTNADKLSATFSNNTIMLKMPVTMINELANTDQVGFENNMGTPHLLVEKDFTCLDNVAEDQSDNYPNPLAENMYEKGN